MKVVKREDSVGFHIFDGILGRIIFNSENVMFLLVEIEPRGVVPEHSHPHEQMGVCLKGKAEFRSGEESVIVDEGTFYWIKPGEKHSVVSLVDEVSLFLDVFNPPREDYLEKAEMVSENKSQ
ncbi:cupin domain-containing protein [Candidatus Bathyarchaeota archaeon]|nr:cupin domain-containing protein [Candidatus Bathyarchaeota archaeon]